MRPHLLPKRRKLRSYRIVANLFALQGRALRGLILLYADDAGRPGSTVNPHPEERSVSKDEAESGMAAMSEKFNAMGQQVYIDAAKVKESNKVL
jgi:hypothetical protein